MKVNFATEIRRHTAGAEAVVFLIGVFYRQERRFVEFA